jgi:hypothetical protein
MALQAGALNEGADFKIELIVYFLGHWFHFMYTIVAAIMFKGFKNSKETVSYHKIGGFTSGNITSSNI